MWRSAAARFSSTLSRSSNPHRHTTRCSLQVLSHPSNLPSLARHVAHVATSDSSLHLPPLSPQFADLASDVLAGKLHALSRAITLCESTRVEHRPQAAALLQHVLLAVRQRTFEKRARGEENVDGIFRIGITGPPGAGKSSLIERLGMCAVRDNQSVAVLAIDPLSHASGGSILGDKTRMEKLSAHPKAFIRPTPSRGEVGGLARNTADAALLCEASGCHTLMVETVGGGQADVGIARIVDMVLLLLPPAGGDELQGIKKGVVEVADLVAVNKADGGMESAAMAAVGEYSNALHFVRPRHDFWTTPVMPISSRTGMGIEDLWKRIGKFQEGARESGGLERIRTAQRKELLWSTVEAEILYRFRAGSNMRDLMRYFEEHAINGDVAARAAAVTIVESIFNNVH